MSCGLAIAALLLAAGCAPVRLSATSNIPTPLIVKIPVAVALYVPKEFSEYEHKEERAGTKWDVALGKAQSEGLSRLLTAMFERVVVVDSVNAGAQLGSDIRAILEPSVEEYAFVTPTDAGSAFYAVSIKYRVNVYSPDGRLADSWGFTGYGTSQAQGMSRSSPMAAATALALRDAGAKLAVEFREQAIVRGLLPESARGPAASPSASPGAAQLPQVQVPVGEAPAAPPSAAPESSTPSTSTPPPSTPAPTQPEAAPPAQPPPPVENKSEGPPPTQVLKQ
jgi:hypothetical protein